MNQIKYQQLKNKIIEAVPEIIELKFGCEIVAYDYISKEIYGTGKIYKAGENESKGYYYAENIHRGIKTLEIKEIIGRDITLEDVFVVLTKTADTRDDYDAKDYVFDLCRMWKLNQPLEKQSDETLEFLYNLLIKK